MSRKILIIGVHQSYVKSYAGGYIRLKEFIKNIPKTIQYSLVDIRPSIYPKTHPNKAILFYIPNLIQFFIAKAFPVGVLMERIYSAVAIYKITKKNIIHSKINLIYLPFGELLHLYIPVMLLKKRYPHIKIVVDILNFENIKTDLISQINKFRKEKLNLVNSIIFSFVHTISYTVLKKTINEIDYIFTVSPELVNSIKKIYKKNSIDFTPSGISIPKYQDLKKKYLGIYVGRITEQKGMYHLLNTWSSVVKSISDAKLAIVGAVNKSNYELMIKEIKMRKLTNNIEGYRLE